MNRSAALLLVILYAPVQAQETPMQEISPLDALLERMRADQLQETRDIQERLARFRSAAAERKALLDDASAQVAAAEKRSRALEEQFADGEQAIKDKRAMLDELTVHYQEVLATAKLWAIDLKEQFQLSLVSAQLPHRIERLSAIAAEEHAITISDMHHLMYASLEEASQQGAVARFDARLTLPDGTPVEGQVTRVGVFTASSAGRFLSHADDARNLVILPRQPPASLRATAAELEESRDGQPMAIVDPSRGAILTLLVDAPGAMERINQGGVIGYLIILIGIFGVLFALSRSVVLAMHMRRIMLQQQSIELPNDDNALGRIALTWREHADLATEDREDRVHEAIDTEVPKLHWGLNLLRVLATIAPLLGLLGTVTGMIQTFQSITLFGTGDPRMMAGGISQALITTALGLGVAIPILLLLTVARSYSTRIRHIIEEQGMGLLARGPH